MHKSFEDLRALYRRVQDGSLDSGHFVKAEWKKEVHLPKGVVNIAMQCLAALLDPDITPTVRDIGSGVLQLSRGVEYRGCRIELFGTNNPDEIPRSLQDLLIDRSREALCFCILPFDGLSLFETIAKRGESIGHLCAIIPLYPSDINALALEATSIQELVEYKLIRRIISERKDPETQFAPRIFDVYNLNSRAAIKSWQNIESAIDAKGETYGDWLEHPLLQSVDTSIESGSCSMLIGDSSSGKTVLAFQVAQRRKQAGWAMHYVNMAEMPLIPSGIVQELLFPLTDDGLEIDDDNQIENALLIADDLQSRPLVSKLLLATASLAQRTRSKGRIVLLAVSWASFAREANDSFPEIKPFTVHANLVCEKLRAAYGPAVNKQAAEALVAYAGKDVYLFRLALELAKQRGASVTLEQVARDYWQQKVQNELPSDALKDVRWVAIVIAAIGQFDIYIPRNVAARLATVDDKIIERLVETHFLRQSGDNVTLGHRSLCALMVAFLEKEGVWLELKKRKGPSGVYETVYQFLNQSGTASTIVALRAIVARAGFRQHNALNERAHTLIEIWRAFEKVVERVEYQQNSDPTWGATPSSIMFAVTILKTIGQARLAEDSLRFLRSHWKLSGSNIEIETKGFATEGDFAQLREKMILQDKGGAGIPIASEKGADIDVDRFHRNWLAGMILGSEAAAEKAFVPVDRLCNSIERLQIKSSGAFYPQRVPWCSARILLGLTACGRTMLTSTAVKHAVEWLFRERDQGGAAKNGIWEGNTKDWNSPEETTGLVILALVRAGIDPSDERLQRARTFLMENVEKLNGLDASVAVDALLAVGVPWDNLAKVTRRIANWVLDAKIWEGVALPAVKPDTQSCAVIQTATHLVSIGWSAIRQDLKELLQALDIPDSSKEFHFGKLLGSSVPQSNIDSQSTRPDAESIRLAEHIKQINSLRVEEYTVVGDYVRFEQRVRHSLRDRYNMIQRGITNKSTARENHLVWAPAGSGKSFFIQEIARSNGEEFFKNQYIELNIAKRTQEYCEAAFQQIKASSKSMLCMIDEFDGRSGEEWPYELIFKYLDLNHEKPDASVVFVVVGSSENGLKSLIQTIRSRPKGKGKDLIDRIPESNWFEIPSQLVEDRLVIFVKQLLIAANQINKMLPTHLDKLAALYVLQREWLTTPRQLAELALRTVAKMQADDPRVLYDNLFWSGDKTPMQFYAQNIAYADSLHGTFIEIAQR